MVPAARFLISTDGEMYCDAFCQEAWTQREIKKITAQVISIAQELKMDCCYTAEEVHHSRFFQELKEMAMKIVRQIKNQLLKAKERIRKAKVYLLDELHGLVQKLLSLLGVEEDFALPI
jgi:vacuolar-type H+-ATPase subunit E/Vma4